jgi:hypothetical protein
MDRNTMPTMPPPKAQPAPGAPGYTGDPNGEAGIGATKEAALTIGGLALFLASRGRLNPGLANFTVKTAATTLTSAGVLSMMRAGGHGDEQSKIQRQRLLAAVLKQAGTQPGPSGQLVTIVNRKTGERTQVPIETMQALIDRGVIRVRSSKTGKPVVKIEMKKPWLADP